MLEVESAGLSDPGRHRENNEDSIGSFIPEEPGILERKGVLFALADGVGGHQAGEVASAVAVSTVVEEYYSPSNHHRIEPALRHAIQVANLRLHDLGQHNQQLRSMETTLTVLVLAGAHGYLAHVGDSRIYHWRAGQLSQITSDHSEVAELVRMRVVSPDRAREHPGRGILTRTVGGRLIVRPDFHRFPVEAGDQFILCSDGLWSEVRDEEVADTVAVRSPSEACRSLLDLALARDAADNISLQVVKIRSISLDLSDSPSREGWLSGIISRVRWI